MFSVHFSQLVTELSIIEARLTFDEETDESGWISRSSGLTQKQEGVPYTTVWYQDKTILKKLTESSLKK